MKKFSLLFLFSLLFWAGKSQDFSHIALDNRIYTDDIYSVKLCPADKYFGTPIIKLNSGEQLRLVFDHLGDYDEYMKYTLIHCSHDWQLSPMNPLEYLDGFMEDEITDNSYSFNTITGYTHFELLLPNDLLRITKSGNYILFVYDETPENPILTQRFMVVESTTAGIVGTVQQAQDVNYISTHQQVDFLAYTGNYNVRNPSMLLNATILQNGRWDNAIIGLKFRSANLNEYNFSFDNLNKNIFSGGAEFRTFDLRTLRTTADRIVSINFNQKINQAYVLEDIARPYAPYQSDNTISGRCFWLNDDFEGKNTEDYVLTHFSLRCDFPVSNGDLYVFGELTNWKIMPEAKLKYNPALNYWETSLLLKQGYYNYQYVFVPYGENKIDETYIEGSHWQTLNEYTILLYLKEEGTSYDKLIGTSSIKIEK